MGGGAGQGSDGSPGVVRPGTLSALLQEIAAAPQEAQGGAWEAALRPGATVGKFELIRELGRGGFGVVWEARDRDLRRGVAFKAVSAGGKAGLREERLLLEAEAAARLSHPNIVTLFDVGRAEQGPYLVLELLQGRTLEERLSQGRLSLREAVRIASEVAKGVAHAHGKGVVHRDLKPGNVFLCDDGQVKVLDFGLAHAFGQKRQDGGTPAYMAPEQWQGAPEDERTDVFALGVLLFRMLADELPFPEDGGKAVQGPGKAPELEVSELPGLGELVARMLEKGPVARPRDGKEVSEALRAFHGELERVPTTASAPVTTRPRAGLPGLLSEVRRRRMVPALVGYATFALIALRVVDWLVQTGRLPGWALPVALALLGFGLAVSLLLAWTYDLTGQGIRRTPAAGAGNGPARPRRARLTLLLAALGLLAAAPGLVYYLAFREGGRNQAPEPGRAAAPSLAGPVTLAVLPLVNLSGEASQDYFSDGMTEEIIGKLSRLAGLAVTARSSVSKYKGSERGAREIGKELGVAYVLEGSVRRAGDRIRVSAALVKTADAFHIWSESIDGKLDDIFDVQERIATRIVEALNVRLTPDEAGSLRRWGTRNTAAYDEYLRGQVLVEHFHIPEKLEAARGHFELALRIDPEFAPAMAGLASAEAQIYRNVDSSSGRLARASALVKSALAIDPRLTRALFTSGEIRGVSYDYLGAAADFRQVVALEPRNYLAWDYLCWVLGYATPPQVSEAEMACRRAIETNPSYAESYYHLARALIPQGRLAEAEQAIRQLEEHFPNSSFINTGRFWIHLGSGRPREALADLERGQGSQAFSRGTSLGRACKAMALAQLGEGDRALVALEEALALGYRDEADLRAGRFFEPLRADPRFARLLARHGIEPSGRPQVAHPLQGQRPPEGRHSAPPAPSIAVLPFADMSPGKDQEYFADGVAEEILNALTQVKGLKVVGRTSSFSFKGKKEDLKTIGRKLGVVHVLEGSVRREGERVRITAQLVKAADGYRLWSEAYDRGLTGILTTQEDIARAVVATLQVKLLSGTALGAAEGQTANSEAHNQYLLGIRFAKQGSGDGYRRAEEALRRAIGLDPGFAAAHARLADALWGRYLEADAGTRAATEQLQRSALAAAEMAVKLAPGLADGYQARGRVRWAYLLDWAGASADLERALTLNPSHPETLMHLGRLVAALGDQPRGISLLREASELDPLSHTMWLWLGFVYLGDGQHASGRAALERAVLIAPEGDWPLMWLGVAQLLERQAGLALATTERSRVEAVRLWGQTLALHSLGNAARSRQSLGRLVAQSSHAGQYQIAEAFAWRGEQDQAFEWLDRSLREHDGGMTLLTLDPLLGSLHSDPRWKALLRKMNLPVE